MVGEFPELQGLMGGYYARAEGLPDEVADAIRDHYKPVGQGDDVPTAPVTVAVSLADKLDTISAFFGIDQKPTGSKDPFALRRAALGVLELINRSALRMPLTPAIRGAMAIRAGQEAGAGVAHRLDRATDEVLAFLADRLKVQQREAGVRHDLIDAVFALGGEDDLVRLLARVRALQAFVGTADGANLLAGYKRAANILKKEGYQPTSAHPERSRGMSRGGSTEVQGVSNSLDSSGGGESGADENSLSYTPEPAERALIEALAAAEPRARDAIAVEDFAAAMGALASLRGPIDAFFDAVTVNDPDPAKRAARLALLDRFRSAVHQVADFSKIEG
jgi:glycyl-tRNA synthetase beta chain